MTACVISVRSVARLQHQIVRSFSLLERERQAHRYPETGHPSDTTDRSRGWLQQNACGVSSTGALDFRLDGYTARGGAMKPSRVCPSPGCGSLQPCDRHVRKPFANVKHAGGRAWQATRARIFRRDGGRCRYCRASVTLALGVVDHVVNRAAGGSDADVNLTWCCRPCNEAKRCVEARAGRGANNPFSKTNVFPREAVRRPVSAPVSPETIGG